MRAGVAIVVTSVVVAAVAVLLDGSDSTRSVANFVFGTIVVASFLTAMRLAIRAGRRGVEESRRVRELAATREAITRRALVDERARLTADVVEVVRRTAGRMSEHADSAHREWDRCPEPALRDLQEHGRRAGVELRHLLGLLRDTPPAPEPPAPGGPRPSIRYDGLPAVLVTALAVVEHHIYPSAGPVSLLLTVFAAAMIVFRRVAPGPGAACCGLILAYSVGTAEVTSGFWVLATLGGLMWAATARHTVGDAAGAVVLAAGASAGFAVHDPENLGITVAVLVVGGVAGAVVGWSAGAHSRADRGAAEQAAAIEHAVAAERLVVARDLHDVVSHAVGVMVMQAGAALVLRASDPTRARRSLDVVRGTAADTVEQRDRLVAVVGPDRADRDGTALHVLVDRMRAGGLAVNARIADGGVDDTVYRIVQEALTNAVRHAPGASVQVTVTARTDATCVEIVDDGPGPVHDAHAGYGLVGLAERVHRQGGELSTGPGPGGHGFRVAARLPVPVRMTR